MLSEQPKQRCKFLNTWVQYMDQKIRSASWRAVRSQHFFVCKQLSFVCSVASTKVQINELILIRNKKMFTLLSCLSTPYIKFTDPNGIPVERKEEGYDKAIPRYRIFICMPAYQQGITRRAYQSVYRMQEAFSASDPQPRPVTHCCKMEFSCPVIRRF